jgi:hypothetical protein
VKGPISNILPCPTMPPSDFGKAGIPEDKILRGSLLRDHRTDTWPAGEQSSVGSFRQQEKNNDDQDKDKEQDENDQDEQ